MPGCHRFIAVLLLLQVTCADAIDLRDYFPTPNGTTWLYTFSTVSPAGRCSGQRSVTVDGAVIGRVRLVTTVLDVDECSTQAARAQLQSGSETFTTDAAGRRLVARGESGTELPLRYQWEPSMLVLPNRAQVYQAFESAGSLSESDGERVRAVSYRATLKVVGLEKMVVPAGTFTGAVHLQLTETREYPPPLAMRVVVRTDRWLARTVGTVRLKTEVAIDGTLAQSSQLQLACATISDVQSARCAVRSEN